MMRLLLVRHADSEYAGSGRYWGHTDVGLGPVGFKQAERLRDRLAEEELHCIYSSDLQRALRTAQIIASAHQVDLIPCSELQEISFGEFEGMSFRAIEKRFPGAAHYWVGEDACTAFPGGESLNDLQNRVESFLNRLVKYSPEQTVLIVAHGGPLRIMLCGLLGISMQRWWNMRLDPASLTMLDTYPEGPILHLLNDICHLHHSPGSGNSRQAKLQPGG